MGKNIFWPYTLADERHIFIDNWERSINEKLWISLEEPIQEWDKSSGFFVRTNIDIDGALLRESADLEPETGLKLVVILDCVATRQRIVESIEIGSRVQSTMTIEIPPGKMHGTIQIEAHVTAKSSSSGGFVGRRLVAEPQKWAFSLSENPTRFPTEAFSFRNSNIPNNLEWKVVLQVDHGDLWNSAFSRAVELWVNTDIEESSRALLDSADPSHKHYLSLVERDIVWNIAFRIAYEDGFEREENDPPPGSVGASVQAFVENNIKVPVSDYISKVRLDPLGALDDVRIALPIHKNRKGNK